MTTSQALRELFSNAPTDTDSYRLAMDAAEEIDRLRHENADLLDRLKILVIEGECYCADEFPRPCGHCQAQALLAHATGQSAEGVNK